MKPLYTEATESGAGQVDDYGSEIGRQSCGLLQVRPALEETCERLLDEILSDRHRARQQIGQADRAQGLLLI